ncbi:MAG: nicotinate-nucleotide adenylyltransferase [Acidobacteria bacterium]|nr:nicotinate-nucleotide adenylyltransferase [Acidobacteriota bacterium]
MKIAIFGGTFDPVHTGHLQAAQAAVRKYHLDKVLFIPTGYPPHKLTGRLTEFHHRFAMVALACAGNPRLVPSALEAPDSKQRPHYSIDTARRLKRLLGPRDELYFLIGMDAFLDLPYWRQFRRLLDLVNFIVVSRPGFDSREIQKVVPADILAKPQRPASSNRIRLRKTTLHILEGVEVPVASRDIRQAIRRKRSITGGVPPLVEQYILKEGLYSSTKRLRGGR